MSGRNRTPPDQELEKLRKRFVNLLQIAESNKIHFSTFWNDYKRDYGSLPDPEKFNINKRSEFFDKLNDVVNVVGVGKDRFVTLNPPGSKVKSFNSSVGSSARVNSRIQSGPKAVESQVIHRSDQKKATPILLIGDSSSEDEEGLPEGFMSGGVGRPHAGGRMMPGAEHRQHQQPYPLFGGHGSAEDGPAVVFSANPLPAAMNVSMQYPVQPAQAGNFYTRFAQAQRTNVPQNDYTSDYPLPNQYGADSRREHRLRHDTQEYGHSSQTDPVDHGRGRHDVSHSRDRRDPVEHGRGRHDVSHNQDRRVQVDYGRGRQDVSHNQDRHTVDHGGVGQRARDRGGGGYRGKNQYHSHQAVLTQTKEQLDAVAQDCIDRLSDAKEYVSCERIEKLIIQHYSSCKVACIQDLGLRKLEDINVIYEHVRKQCRVNAYITAFVKVRPIATLYELGESLKDFVTEGQDLETMKLGPLQKQPLVYEHFKFPVDKDIPEIDTWDVIEMLRDYLSKHSKWSSRDLDMQEFMMHIKEERDCESPYETGVKIKSLPLAVTVLKRAQRDCSQNIKSVIQQQKESIQDDVMATFRHFSNGIMNKQVGYCEVKKEYLTMTSFEVIIEFSEKISTFYNKLNSWTALSRSEKKMTAQILELRNKMISICSINKTMEAIFRLAICAGKQEIHEQLWDILYKQFGGREGESDDVIVIDDDGVEQPSRSGDHAKRSSMKAKQPSVGDIVVKMMKYLERCLAQGPVSLDLLVKIENKLLDDYDFPDFNAMGQGSFLECMTKTDMVKKLLDDYGGTLIGGSQKSSASGESVFHASLHDVQEFVRQCAVTEPSQIENVEKSLCHHYQLTEVKSLGYGSSKTLTDMANKPFKGLKEPCVFYEAAMCSKQRNLTATGDRQIGVMGHQTKERALACLQNCPLLEDLAEWSHWDLVFHPQFGGLKEFVQKHGKVHSSIVNDLNGVKSTMTTHIFALETKPGTLLKLTADSTADKFATASQLEDVANTCGHLVSMLVSDKGMDNLPTALLGNHMKTALLKMQAKYGGFDDAPGGPSMDSTPSKVCQFVVDCFTTLPLLVCQAVANKIFLEPLAHVIGSTKSKDQLLRAAVTTHQRSRLQILGCAMGIREWVGSFDKRVAFPKDCLQKVETIDDGMGGVIEGIIESDNESVSDEEDVDDNGTISLSDDDDDEEGDANRDNIRTVQDQKLEVKKELLDVEEVEIKDSRESDKAEVMTIDTDSQDGNLDEEADKEDESKQVNSKGDVSDDNVIKIDDGENEDDVDDKEVQKNPCKTVVDQIRKEEFGVDVELSEDAQKLFIKQQERLGRSLDRLSKDLYSKDTHFVLELIQNADDNDYPYEMLSSGSDTLPSVEFLVEKDSISVRNNECGFLEKNIRAVCDVGRSTKGKHKFGYIGQKGIGFKSVFRVTDRPEIHSNGYHICFDIHSGPTGYILPHWIGPDDLHNSDMENKDADDIVEIMDEEHGTEEWTTRIVLPMKDDFRLSGQTRSLAARFHDVHPSLLLFLHRLRNLTVINKVENYELSINRRDLPNNIIQIEHTDGTDSWLVIKKMLDASKISIQAKSGVEVESSEIALAFQLQTKEDRMAQMLPEKQPVFAFLPLRSYGFRFVIQGDFDVPSSREDVDRDSMWNQWLRSEIHKLFVEALDTFRKQPNLTDVEAVCSFLQFVPMEDEILDFFRPVSSSILQQLRAKACLPTHPAKNKSIQWKMPSQLVINKDPLVQEVVSGELLQKHLNLDYLHQSVVHALTPSLCHSLGVQSLTTAHLMDLGRGFVEKLSAMDTDVLDPDRGSDLQRLAKWLTCIYRSMDEFHPNEEVLSQLKQLPIVPLTDGQMIKLEEKTVFFPLADDRKQAKNKTNITFKLIAADINTVDCYLFSTLDDVSNSQVRRLLEMLGVKLLTPRDVLQHHIMPVLKTEAWKIKPRNILSAYVMYIKDQLEEDSHLVDINELRKHVVVDTNQGLKKPVDEPVHFTTAYGNNIDLVNVLPGYKWVLLDARYLQGCSSNADVLRWRQFFEKLGIIDFLALKQEHVTVKQEELNDTPWAQFKELLPPMDTYKIIDFECNEFMSLVAENQQEATLYNQMKVLFTLIDQNWDSTFKYFTTAKVLSVEGNEVKNIDSSFSLLLKEVGWLPAAVVHKGHTMVSGELRVGNELYIRAPETEKLLLHHVPYLDSSVIPQSTFSGFLGIKRNVTIDEVKQSLIEWCSPEQEEEEEGQMDVVMGPKEFRTTLKHIQDVYRYLHENLPPKQLQDLFHEHPVIFYPSIPHSLHDQTSVSSDALLGQFLGRDKVRWADPSGLFDRYKDTIKTTEFQKSCKLTISKLYPDFKELFIKMGRIQKFPELEEYGRLLVELTAITTYQEGLPHVLKLYTIIGDAIIEAKKPSHVPNMILENEIGKVKTILKDERVIPVFGNKWTYVKDKPMIADDKDKEKMWKNKHGVHFVDTGKQERHRRTNVPLEDVHPDKVLALLEFLGIKKLSECEEMKCFTDLYEPCPALQLYVHKLVPVIQQLLCGEFTEVYESLRRRNIKSSLACMQFAQVAKLELVYRIETLPDISPVIVNEKCQLLKNDQEFYVHKDSVEAYNDINKELSRYFSNGDKACFREIKNTLIEMMPFVTDVNKDLEDFLHNSDLVNLPEGEEVWEVQAPLNWPPKPPTPPPPQIPELMYMQQQPEYDESYRQDINADQANIIEEGSEEAPKSNVLKMWPPPAPNRMGPRGDWPPSASGESRAKWPPPAPPQHLDTASLPEGLRPSKLSPQGPRADESNSGVERQGNASRSVSTNEAGNISRQASSSSGIAPTQVSGDGPYVKSSGGGGVGGSGIHNPHNQYPAGVRRDGERSQGDSQAKDGAVGDMSMETTEEGDPSDKTTTSTPVASATDGQGSTSGHPPPLQTPPNFNRSTSQVEMQYVPNMGAQQVITVDDHEEQWVQDQNNSGNVKTVVGNRLPMKRQRIDSNGEDSFTQVPRKPVIFYGNPVWTEAANESVYQSLAAGKEIEIPNDIIVESNTSAPPEIGRWGEKIVKSYLDKVMAENGSEVLEVNWINEEDETGLPYDFIIKVQDPRGEVFDIFVEVKSTLSDKKAFFEISSQEFKYAQKWQENFHVYRVFNVGDTQNVEIMKLVNLASLWDKNLIQLCMVV